MLYRERTAAKAVTNMQHASKDGHKGIKHYLELNIKIYLPAKVVEGDKLESGHKEKLQI